MISRKYSDTQRSVLAATILSSFLGPFLISSVNIALPDIEKEFGLSAVSLSWIVTSYLLSTAVFLIPVGRLADMKGEVRLFKLGMFIFTLSTLLCAISPNGLVLALMRAVQGLGAAMTMTTGAPLLLSNFSSSERGKMLGYNVAAVYLGLAAGPFVGGLLTRYLGWRSVFYFSAFLGISGIVLTILKLKKNITVNDKGKFDLTGALLYGSALVLIVYYSSHLNAPNGLPMILLGVLLLFLFVFQCRKTRYPLFDTTLFTGNRIFAFSNVAALINYSATASLVFLMSLFLQKVKGLPPQMAGAILVSQPLVMALLSPYAGKLSDRIEPRILATSGMFMNAAGLLFLANIGQDTPLYLIIAVLAFMGLGFAFFSSPNMNTIMGSVGKTQMSTASGTASTMRIMGHMVSMTIVTFAFSTKFNGLGIAQVSDYLFVNTSKFIYLVCFAMCLLGVFFSYSRGDLRK